MIKLQKSGIFVFEANLYSEMQAVGLCFIRYDEHISLFSLFLSDQQLYEVTNITYFVISFELI